jgi:nucleoside-diphosphate-sugar epimerase
MILVTGGTGLVGAHLLYQLTTKNDVIKAIYRPSSNLDNVKTVFSYYTKNVEQYFSKIEWVEADIIDVVALETAFENVTKVYHSAALVSFNPSDYKAMRKINIEGTANIVNLCIEKNIEKLCYVSSIATIDKNPNSKLITEENEYSSENRNYGYAITKFGAEMEVWRATQEGVNVVIVNPGIILGGGFWNTGTGAIFDKVYQGLKFYSEGITGYVSVEDVVTAMIALMQSEIKNERFILVSENKSFKAIFFKIADVFKVKKPSIKAKKWMSELLWRIESLKHFITGKTPILTKNSAKSIHNQYYFSSEKIKNELNFEFEPIDTAIERICKQYK